jgi:DNA (cytosine-5)-methyltransferase 1
MLRTFEMFAGYGGSSFALKKAEIPFECVGYSEIKTHAIKCYEKNHCHTFPDMLKGQVIRPHNFGDCTKINPNELPDFDLLTGGFPCTDVSTCGLRDLSKGRTILFSEIIRIAEVKKPKYMLLENVKGIKSKKDFFNFVCSEITRLGYNLQILELNSFDYGTPQNRTRIFFVCSLDKINLNLTKNPNTKEISDFLDDDFDQKYFLKKEHHYKLENKRYRFKNETDLSIPCLTAGHLKGWDDIRIKIGVDTYRYLKPIERFRFMGFFNDEIDISMLKESNAADLAGNGWDINLVSQIFKEMFKNE